MASASILVEGATAVRASPSSLLLRTEENSRFSLVASNKDKDKDKKSNERKKRESRQPESQRPSPNAGERNRPSQRVSSPATGSNRGPGNTRGNQKSPRATKGTERDRTGQKKTGPGNTRGNQQSPRATKGTERDRTGQKKTGSGTTRGNQQSPRATKGTERDRTGQKKTGSGNTLGNQQRRQADAPATNRRPASPSARPRPNSAATATKKPKGKQANRQGNNKKMKVVNQTKIVDRRKIYTGGWSKKGAWAASRPWRHGWYGGFSPQMGAYPGWQWWGNSASNWGAASLAPVGEIQSSVDMAINSDHETFGVQNTEFQVFHDSVKPLSDNEVEFNFQHEDQVYLAKADCQNGLLNDELPSAFEEAELMHAACTIAFNPFEDAVPEQGIDI